MQMKIESTMRANPKRARLQLEKTQSLNWIEFKTLEIPKLSFSAWIIEENKTVSDLIGGDNRK